MQHQIGRLGDLMLLDLSVKRYVLPMKCSERDEISFEVEKVCLKLRADGPRPRMHFRHARANTPRHCER